MEVSSDGRCSCVEIRCSCVEEEGREEVVLGKERLPAAEASSLRGSTILVIGETGCCAAGQTTKNDGLPHGRMGAL